VGVTDPRRQSREDRSRDMLRQIWLRNRVTTMERLAVVGSALADLSAGVLDADRRQAALAEAHKLRGILGTYGFAEGSVLAGEAEDALGADGPGGLAEDLAARLGAYARSLPDG
jgi:HPt (histidine-containing phosphotransfer) domain-containing protein